MLSSTKLPHRRVSYMQYCSILYRYAYHIVFTTLILVTLILYFTLVTNDIDVQISHASTANYIDNIHQNTHAINQRERELPSNKRGYIALEYSGTPRTFTDTFQSHLLNVIASSPYTVHIYMHSYDSEQSIDNELSDTWHNRYTLQSTLNYYDSYIDLDGNIVDINSTIISIELEHMTESMLRYKYEETLVEVEKPENHHFEQKPISVYFMLYSQEAVDLRRQRYERRNKMKYDWVIRMRYDAVYKSNIWESVFNIQPYNSIYNATVPQCDTQYKLGHEPCRIVDMIYEPNLPVNHLLSPGSKSWFGAQIKVEHSNEVDFYAYNDMYGMMNSSIADIYFNRFGLHDGTHVYKVPALLAKAPLLSEGTIRWTIEQHNIPQTELPICYNIQRLYRHRLPDMLPSTKPVRPYTTCSHETFYAYGEIYCKAHCPTMQQTDVQWYKYFDSIVETDDIALSSTDITVRKQYETQAIQQYTKHHHAAIRDSNWYYYYKYRTLQNQQQCVDYTYVTNMDYAKLPYTNIYDSTYLPFIHTSTDVIVQNIYRQHQICQPNVKAEKILPT